MSRAPALFAERRGRRFAALAVLGFAQAAAAAGAAVATRSLFVRWHDGLDPTSAAVGLAAAAAVLALLHVVERDVAEDLGQRYAGAVRRAVFAHLALLPLASVEARRAGGLMLRFTGDLSALSGWASHGAARFITGGVALPLTLAALVWLSPAAAAGAAGPLALGALAMALAGAPLGDRHRRLRGRRSRLASDMGERLRLAPVLRLLGRMPLELDRLDAAADGLRGAALGRARQRALLRAAPELAGGLAAAGAALACWGAGASAAELAGALAALALALGHARALGGAWDRRHAARAARKRLDALFAEPTLPRGRRVRPERRAPALRFAAVVAGPLGGVTATIPKGAKVALIGPTGSGKSTLLRLAAGLAAPEAGRVLLRGVDPCALSTRDRARATIYLGPQTPILAGSLRRVLTLGLRRRPEDAAVIAEAERLGLGGALARLGGLDGEVGEGARELADGERALIAVVRLALAPDALALIDGIDADLDAQGRAVLARELMARPGAALVAPRHDDVLSAFSERMQLGATPA